MRHIHNNLKKVEGCKGKVIKDLLWKAARSSVPRDFDAALVEIKTSNLEGWKYLTRDLIPSEWILSHFSTLTKCDMLLNNICE